MRKAAESGRELTLAGLSAHGKRLPVATHESALKIKTRA
jgi:hypothetical protein